MKFSQRFVEVEGIGVEQFPTNIIYQKYDTIKPHILCRYTTSITINSTQCLLSRHLCL